MSKFGSSHKFGNLKLVKEGDEGMSAVGEEAREFEGVEEINTQSRDIELSAETVKFLDPGTLLKMLLGFHKAREGSDYEMATRSLKETCFDEVMRRMDVEYKRRGCIHLA